MGKYIALVGKEFPNAVNSLWAVLRQERFEPEELYIVFEEESGKTESLKDDLEQVLKNYDLDCSVESYILDEMKDVRQMIDGHTDDEKNTVALDISAASKLRTAEVLIDKGCDLFDHIFYLEISGSERSFPLPTIEKNKLNLKDLRNELTEVR